MYGETQDFVKEYIIKTGYWFLICNGIQSAWSNCDSEFVAGKLASLSDPELPSLSYNQEQ